MEHSASITSFEDWIEANAFASGNRSEVDEEVQKFLCTTPTDSSAQQNASHGMATKDDSNKFNTQSQFVSIETDVRSHFIEEQPFEKKDEEPLNTIDILDSLLKTTGDALQKENQNFSNDETMELSDPSSTQHPQDNKESEWELNNEDGEPIKSFTALKSMLSGCEGDPGDIDGTIPLQDVALPHLASTIKENRKKVKYPVQNHLDATIQRQKNILRRERKNLQRLRFMANTMKRRTRKSTRQQRQVSRMQKSTSLPNFERANSNLGIASSSNIFRKLRKEGAKSYALRQSLRRQYREQQRTFHRKTPDEYHEGRKPQAGMLDDRPTRETFDGFSSLAKYQSMKYERDREINERVRRRRQQDVQDDVESRNNQIENNFRDDNGRADIFAPWTMEYNSSMERDARANHDANLLETSASFENDYARRIQRQINMERIIEAKHKRLELREQILRDANNQVQDYARESAVKKRALSSLLHTSHLNNTWNRFEANFGRQLEQNQLLLHDLDYAYDQFKMKTFN